jgi:hypothetical protein
VLPGPGALSFQRFYNSAGSGSADLSPGWRHSYSRSITATTNPTPYQTYQTNSSSVSAQFADPATACVSGFSQIQSQVAAWQGANASWSGSACVLQNAAGTTIGTIQVFSVFEVTPASAITEIDATRDDGQLIRFPVINGVLTPPPGQSFQVQ